MDFTISRDDPEKPEKVTLMNAIMGNGELKNLAEVVHTPYQIKLQQYYNDKQLPKVASFTHPLFRSIEIADTDGTLSRKLTSDQEGHLSIRFPYTPALSKIELYSITPDKGTQKIYTLLLKP
ncbi:hypothetical protein EXU85_11215 [Spirosoma sp. KCTC 42546]|uniref:hypothetical protein n=1 Tax=Spirosoma sp. KCTC 42546 TaxID=2520506 RepID=UPI00115749E9|nr:hypothetical protein [Spirosoma sp. KCTC 42546]QDK79144.1 hypothetical protein EXU85_11215 [Spirosoma sp. KCTC 42546]